MAEAALTWLITGGCGFIGTGLIARLRESGPVRLRVVDSEVVGTRKDLAAVCPLAELRGSDPFPRPEAGGPVQFLHADVSDATQAAQAVQGADVVVHLAASTGVLLSVERPEQDFLVNVAGTFNYLEAARRARVGRFILASSGAAVGEVVPPVHEEMAPHPASPYGAGKLAGEAYCSAFHRSYGLDTVALRFGNVYGPGSSKKTSVVAKFIQQALRGEEVAIHGDGGQTRDFIFLDDLLEAIVRSARAPVGGEVFQIASSREVSINELASALGLALSREGITLRMSHGDAPPGEVRRSFSDTSKARQRLGWQPKVDLDTGLGRSVRWFLQRPRVLG